MHMKNHVENIILGLLTALWGVALIIFGPFYSRGYLVPRSIGIFFVIFGTSYILVALYRKDKKK
jgi:uncharacterized membrane protein HdeD (DUF308 family)